MQARRRATHPSPDSLAVSASPGSSPILGVKQARLVEEYGDQAVWVNQTGADRQGYPHSLPGFSASPPSDCDKSRIVGASPTATTEAAAKSLGELKKDIGSAVQKLEWELWHCLDSWHARQENIRSRVQGGPKKKIEPQFSDFGSSCIKSQSCQGLSARPEEMISPQRGRSLLDETVVEVAEMSESPMSCLLPRVLDMSEMSISPEGTAKSINKVAEDSETAQKKDEAVPASIDDSNLDQSDGGILRVSSMGLDFTATILQGSPLSPISAINSEGCPSDCRGKIGRTPAWVGPPQGRILVPPSDADLPGLPDVIFDGDGQKDQASLEESPLIAHGSRVASPFSPSRHPSGRKSLPCSLMESPDQEPTPTKRLVQQQTAENKKKKRRGTRVHSPLAKKRNEQLLATQSRIERLTRSNGYEVASACAILLNALFIVWQTEYRSRLAESSPSEATLRANTAGGQIISDVFCIIFFADLCCRMIAERWLFFTSKEWRWNIFDVVVVGVSIIETLFHWQQYVTSKESQAGSTIGKLSMLRIVRLARVITGSRRIRVSRFFRELRIMVFSLFGAVKSLVWAAILVLTSLLIFGVFFTDGAVDFARKTEEPAGGDLPSSKELVLHFFRNLTTSTISLYMAMSGGVDWGDIWEALQPLPLEYRAAFLCFLTFSILALLNVVTAVFVETAMQRSQNDRELLIQQEMENKVEFVDTMQRVFEELDGDGNGTLSLEEFEKQMEDENILAFMSTLQLDCDQLLTLLTLLDRDGNGEVDIEEFISGCLRLKGGAKAMDMAILQYQVEWILNATTEMSEILKPAASNKSAASDKKADITVAVRAEKPAMSGTKARLNRPSSTSRFTRQASPTKTHLRAAAGGTQLRMHKPLENETEEV
eukprot:TRINITY_DN14038_c0_g1_i1.p1 TRINITY_DN14038_c0_g1~~TRINITY_DN14038_c0_g1_i1.p1  ORF type:complete len:884 (-),score=139.57 TRINITY_DN14038_c0_g1_i1:245-2896(-)